MDQKKEGTLAIVAALFVLLSSLWDPRVSAAIAVLALAGLGMYLLLRKHRT